MNSTELNKYYIDGSKIKISLKHYYVEVDQIISPYKYIYYEMTINDKKGEQTKLDFNSLEEAVNFIENKIKNSSNLLEIINIYNDSNKKL